MPHGLNNWCYSDVIDFIKERGFEFFENRKGSHEAWISKDKTAIIEIQFHGKKSFVPRTLETMIRQSKIDKKEWRKWASS